MYAARLASNHQLLMPLRPALAGAPTYGIPVAHRSAIAHVCSAHVHLFAVAALRAMGIGIRSQLLSPDGRRPSSSSSTAPQGALSDPGPRRTTTGGSRLPPGKGGADPLAAWKASDARAAWIAKKQTAPVAATATQIFVPEMTKPKRGGKAETTRD